eukprot:TRINITY_DN7686_c0_g1_i9.p3 TRINITY_DN7686_c0_g1~~TRINITY_DN7686_c0_g1_i9.p3  ORF type:complete len:110 (+),score=14.67 TRINITY_DN7686_c0_g1_i9:1731-2060(+)
MTTNSTIKITSDSIEIKGIIQPDGDITITVDEDVYAMMQEALEKVYRDRKYQRQYQATKRGTTSNNKYTNKKLTPVLVDAEKPEPKKQPTLQRPQEVNILGELIAGMSR